MRKALLFLFLLCSVVGKANVIYVTSTGDSGVGTLRQAVLDAVSADTILIDVKGDISLNSSITMTSKSNLTIIGPSPKHCSVRNSGSFTSGTTLFQLTSCTNIKFEHFGFVGNSAVNVRAITASNSSLTFERMLFKDFVTTGNGAAFNITSSTINIRGCSFIDNSAEKGGAITVTTSTVNIENTTFSGNYANNQGGAIYVISTTTVNLTHNTFVLNDSPIAPTTYLSSGGTNQTNIQGNAIGYNGTGGQFNAAPGTILSTGGNAYRQNSLDPVTWSVGSDVFSTVLDFQLRTAILEDGYGLMYYPIINSSSALIDKNAIATLSFDCRNAPRKLKSSNVSPLNADAGACEYTPLRVTLSSGSTAGTLPWALAAGQNFNTVNYIEFDIASPTAISPTAVLTLGPGTYIIDGFSQPLSAVPGPDITGGTGVTPAALPIQINGGSVAQSFLVSSNNNKISGVRMTASLDAGIFLFGSTNTVFGCEIGIDDANNSVPNVVSGIHVGGNNNIIGGKNHWSRNVISGNGISPGIEANVYITNGASSTQVYGNIIGLRDNGKDIVTGPNASYGIKDLGSNSVIGASLGGNVISASTQSGIYCGNCQGMILQSNTIGMAYDKLTSKSNVTGVSLDGASVTASIGGIGVNQGNLISGNNSVQLRIDVCSNVSIVGNFIGPDKNGNAAPVTTTHGIYIDNPAANSITIGGATPAHRNIISGNQNGIYFNRVGTGCQVLNNYIGLNFAGNAALANTVCGIIFQPTVTNAVTIGGGTTGNVISGHVLSFGSAVVLSGTAAHIFKGNIIGLDATGTTAIPNYIGITVGTSSGATIGGNFATEGNTISGNTLMGILVDNGAANTTIRGNKIGTNKAGTLGIPNGSYGIEVRTATNTQIGGAFSQRNIISGAPANMAGIILKLNGTGTIVRGNVIGGDGVGTAPIPNYNGIELTGTHEATIGGASGFENYIVASANAGILENSTANCIINGNFIGIGVGGATAGLGNFYGIHITAQNATIGSTNFTVISNNTSHGIYVEGDAATNVHIDKAIIGTNAASDPNLGNDGDGIHIFDADGVEIGATTGNTIIGNNAAGIRLNGTVTGTLIRKNIIADPVANTLTNQIGIYLQTTANGNTIGGDYTTQGNTIGNSIEEGILIESNGNFIYGNKIGNNGTIAKSNATGIRISGASNTLIGDESGKENVISGNTAEGILLENANGVEIRSNRIGITAAGNVALPNVNGIKVLPGSTNVMIGGVNNPPYGNTISSNNNYGIWIQAPGITVAANYIGPTLNGTAGMTNQDYGIFLDAGATNCGIGGLTGGTDANIISSNSIAGILINDGNNLIQGNIIGVSTSFGALGTQPIGIELSGSNATANQIGGVNLGNVIMGNSAAGIRITNAAHTNLVAGNYIGISPTNLTLGTQPMGVELTNTAGIDNQIGDDVTGGQNIISGNLTGIKLVGPHSFIYNNRIGTSVDGLSAKPNISVGIHLLDAGFNTIGGPGLQSNLISGNTGNGIALEGSLSISNVIVGNTIGTNLTMTAVLPNVVGIRVENSANSNFIGQAGPLNGNTISGNSVCGLVVSGSTGNLIVNNKIGLPFANPEGLILENAADNNVVGGTDPERNIISNNTIAGIAVKNSTGNMISGNFIGTNATGNAAAGNTIGIHLDGSDQNEIGNPTHFNLISSNGIGILVELSTLNSIRNNYIGTDLTGNATFAGGGNGTGIVLKDANDNTIGGDNTLEEENIICNNTNQGIRLVNADANHIHGNHIGINKAGTGYLGNGVDGIWFRAGSDNNELGTTTAGFANAIAANGKGIHISASAGNQVSANFIGNNLTGTGTLSGTNNQQIGIHIDSTSSANIISNANVVSGNINTGIRISGKNTKNNVVKGNKIGVQVGGTISLPNAAFNIVIGDTAKFNLIGGSILSDRNYIGGNTPAQIRIENKADSNQVAGNYIGLGQDGTTMYTSDNGVLILGNSEKNTIGGGLPGQGNTIVGFADDGIRITGSNYNSILGNRIGIKPDNSVGTIGDAGIQYTAANFNWVGGYLVGSDSMNTITNCNTGVAITSFILNSYGNVIAGNSIYNNVNQGIDINGDGLVLDIDTNNTNILANNYEIDRPEIVSAWTCADGNTWVGFKFYSSNIIPPNYHVTFFQNPTPDVSGFGEGENYIGYKFFNPQTTYDTIIVDLGMTLAPGTILTAAIIGSIGNTSEFSEQFVITGPPTFTAPITTDETCFTADNGTVEWAATGAYSFSYDGGTTWIDSADIYNDTLPTGSYTIDAKYLNGCTQSQNIILNPGLALPFDVIITPDTCDLTMGAVIIDTISTNAGGGSGNYIYTFNGGAYYGSALDTVAIDGGVYNIGLLDTTLGCASIMDAITIPEITEVEDESFVYDGFCPLEIPVPASIATPGGIFSFLTIPGDGATIDGTTGEIYNSVIGNAYDVIYSVGICQEKDTISVMSNPTDDPTFIFDDFCFGSTQNIIPVEPGGTFSFGIPPTDGATIDAVTGIISGLSGATYNVKYITDGPCVDSTTQDVTVLVLPAAPQIVATDSVYCPGDPLAFLSTITSDTPNWMIGSSSGTVEGTVSTFTPASINTGSNFIYLVIIDALSCKSAADSINYYLADVSALTAGTDIETCVGSMVQLNASGALVYAWAVNDDLTELGVANPTVKVDDADDYLVTMLDPFGCVVTDTVHVSLLPLEDCYVETYNAFSPNGDNKNDFWIIDGIEGYPENTVTIFNRWGDVMVKFENYNNTTVLWDGYTGSEKLVVAGTYYYVVDVDGDQNQSGWVQVIH